MKSFRFIFTFAVFLTIQSTLVFAADTKTYKKMSGGYYIDYCHGLSPCGKKVAAHFCKSRGHKSLSDFKKSPHKASNTKYANTGKKCSNPFGCNYFQYIKCTKTLEQLVLRNPKIGGHKNSPPIDYCYTYGTSCGLPVANQLCRDKGYKRAIAFKKSKGKMKTFMLGSRKFCYPGNTATTSLVQRCHSFDYIRCVK